MNTNIDTTYNRTEAGETSHGVWPGSVQIYEKEEPI